MEKLNFETETINRINLNDLDSFVQNNLGFKRYEFVCVEEANNRSSYKFSVSPEYNNKIIGEWKNGNFRHYSNHHILNYICFLGGIPAGKYIIDVSW